MSPTNTDQSRFSTPDALYDYHLAKRAFESQRKKMESLTDALPEMATTVDKTLQDHYAAIGQTEADMIFAGAWTRTSAEVSIPTEPLHRSTSVIEQRMLAMAHVLSTKVDIDLTTYKRAADKAKEGIPVVDAMTESQGIVEPRMVGSLNPQTIAAWRLECDRAVANHHHVMHTQAGELDRQASDARVRAVSAVERMKEYDRETRYQQAFLTQLKASNDGSENYAKAIETTTLRLELAQTNSSQAMLEAQSHELAAESLTHKAIATRRQADYDVEATKIFRLERVEKAIGKYWTNPDLYKQAQAELIEIQRMALDEASQAHVKAQALWQEKLQADMASNELDAAISRARVELDTKRLELVYAEGRIRFSSASQFANNDPAMLDILERARANIGKGYDERMKEAAPSAERDPPRASMGMGRGR